MSKRVFAISGWLLLLGIPLLPSATGAELGGGLATSRPAPQVRVVEAEECIGVARAAVTSDSQANGGKGAEVVLLRPDGPGLSVEMPLEPGIYWLSLIARSAGGNSGVDLMALEVREHTTGLVRAWTMPVAYGAQYGPVGRMYFPAHAGGRYTLQARLVVSAPNVAVQKGTLGGDPGGTAKFAFNPETRTLLEPPSPLLVDRLEIGDALENCPKKALKTQRMLTTDEELAKIRRDFAEQYAKGRIDLRGSDYDVLTPSPPAREPEERKQRNDALWNMVPDYNELMDAGSPSYRRLFGGRRYGFAVDSAALYEQTGNSEIGWDAAVSLCALAEKYPAFDASVQLAVGYRYSVAYADKYGDLSRLVRAYDQVFDFIKNNEPLAEYVGSKIAWVKTPQDVVKLLDTHLLQAGFQSLYRTYEARGVGYPVGALIALVQGVCEESDRILEQGVFRAFEGFLPHKFFVWGPLDDLSYITPFRGDIWRVASYLDRYCRAGGSPRFDLTKLHPGYSTRQEIGRWEQVHLSGGYRAAMPSWVNETRTKFWPNWPDPGPADVGGHMDLFVTITQSAPSRVVEDVGGTHIAMGIYRLSILESGQFQDDLLKMRGAWVQYNTLGLPLQATAHGGLSLSHFNRQSHQELGTPAIPGRDAPNATNIVVVDTLMNFPRVNLSGVNYLVNEGSAFPAGMNTAFAPLSGAQFMEHRQTPFRNVSLYMRQDAMIDVGDADSYIFDVVRVRGGRMHAYCLHAVPGRFQTNIVMQPVATTGNPDLDECLRGYYQAMQSQEPNPPVIQADWVMDPVVQKAQQDQDMAMTTPAQQAKKLADPRFRCNQYDPERPVTTRASILGRPDDRVMVGQWSTVRPDLHWWVLYVQGRQQDEGRESVYPVIIETFAGKPFLGDKRLVAVAPEQRGAEAAVGVEVRTVDGRADLLYCSAKPLDVTVVDGKVRMSGRFAMISRDGDGLRQMCLVGGSELTAADALIKPYRTNYDLRIVDARYDERRLTVSGAVPAALLKNEHVAIVVNGKPYRFKVINAREEGERTVLYYEGARAKIYQSNLVGVDEAQGRVSVQIPPYTVRGGMTVTNEKQDRFWRVEGLPEGLDKRIQGPSWLQLAGEVKTGDFTDANGDGKIKVSACLFGPGDRVTTDAHVNVTRKAIGLYEVASNVACTIGLPLGDFIRAEISADGKTFAPIASTTTGAMLVVKLSEKDLEDGVAVLRLMR